MMKAILDKLFRDFKHACVSEGVQGVDQQNYLKWLRYYLDYCERYEHPPEDREGLMPFLQKLALKSQSRERQEEAAASLELMYQ